MLSVLVSYFTVLFPYLCFCFNVNLLSVLMWLTATYSPSIDLLVGLEAFGLSSSVAQRRTSCLLLLTGYAATDRDMGRPLVLSIPAPAVCALAGYRCDRGVPWCMHSSRRPGRGHHSQLGVTHFRQGRIYIDTCSAWHR